MPDFDLLVRQPAGDIGIANGKFAELGRNLRGTAAEEIDASALTIFPGVIDSHVHFNEPGRADWEGFATGSAGAAAGGTTTIFDMPLNSHPPTIDGASFDAKRAAAERSCHVDFGLWGGLVPGNIGELKTLRDRGAVGLKAFMCNSGIDDFPHVDLNTLRQGMEAAADLGLLVAVHAESEELTRRLTADKIATGQCSVEDYLASRPVEAELDAIQAAIEIAAETKCALHIVHVSTGRGINLVKEARARGVNVTAETCPHYLVLQEGDLRKIGAVAKCAPPLRSFVDHRDLWKRLDGVATIGSDHSPSPPDLKAGSDWFRIWGGISGCQHLLPLLVDAAANGQLKANRIAELTSSNVADRFGIAAKGGIAIGKDADLTLLDMTKTEAVVAESLRYRHKQTPYLGRRLPQVIRTILRGQTIFEDGKLTARPIGKFIRPHTA